MAPKRGTQAYAERKLRDASRRCDEIEKQLRRSINLLRTWRVRERYYSREAALTDEQRRERIERARAAKAERDARRRRSPIKPRAFASDDDA